MIAPIHPVAVITGASEGLGLAMAEAFARAGYCLLLCARRAARLSELEAHLLPMLHAGCFVRTFSCDVSKRRELQQFGEWVLQHGNPQVLINNAGQYLPGNAGTEPEGQLEAMMEVNVYSAYYLSRQLLPALESSGKGHIFNMCSIASLQAYEGGGSYSISKFALTGFTRNLRHELKSRGVKVTGVYPGAAWTKSWEGSGITRERIMQANDVAHMVLAAAQLSPQAVVEDIIMRPQLGDL